MSPEQFDHLLSMVEALITNEDNNYRKSISLAERVALTIRLLLAAGQSQTSLSLSFRIGKSTVSKIIVEIWDALHRLLFPLYVKSSSSNNKWNAISQDFKEL